MTRAVFTLPMPDVPPVVLWSDGLLPGDEGFSPRQYRRQERQNQEQNQRTGASALAHLRQEQLEYLWREQSRTAASTK